MTINSPVSPRLVAGLCLSAALSVSTVLYLSKPSQAASGPISVPVASSQMSFAPLVSKVKPAVVQITSLSGGRVVQQNIPELEGPFGDMLRRYFDQQGRTFSTPQQRALGSGFIVDPAGYIVTNNHVIDGAREVSVTLSDGTEHRARVIGRDDKTDVALIKIDAGHELPYVAFGNSDEAREGDWVLAVGNPYGLGGTVTAGIISAHGRNINEGPYDDFLQIDAPINPGNSGGPLFNQSGQVVGIDTAIYSPSGGSVGIGFAVPSNVAKSVVSQLRKSGSVTRGWLGVSMQSLTPSLAKAVGLADAKGVLVDEVTPGSPAASAGLRQGDVIIAYNGRSIQDGRDLALAVANTPAGERANLSVWREGRSASLTVLVRSQPATKVSLLEPAYSANE
jgi:serine protease Do